MKLLHLGLSAAATLLLPAVSQAQSAVDLYNMCRPDLRGTARFMSMGGAFTALGGDLSSLNQNPAGIGIYRSSELGLTLNLDFQSSSATAQGNKTEENQTKFSFNNFGYVGTMPLNSTGLQSISWGATYSRVLSFDRINSGRIGNLGGASLSNYIAAMSNAGGYYPDSQAPDGLLFGDNYNPYLDGKAGWLDILAFQSYVTNDTYSTDGSGDFNGFQGLMGEGTTGSAWFKTREKGYVDEYSFNIGGNVSDVVYWGVGIGVTDMDYKALTQYGENLNNAYISAKRIAPDQNGNDVYEITNGTADYALTSHLHSSGSGFNFKFGVIVKPINELRLGFAVHTPTWYQMTDTYWGAIDYNYMPSDNSAYASSLNGSVITDEGYTASFDYNMRSPWRMMFGIAGVIGKQGLISADYEYRGNNVMQASDVDGYTYEDVKSDVKTYYKGTHIFRLGGELRVTPQLSLRVGYSYETSPVKKQAENGGEFIWTSGTNPSYSFDRHTQYVTAGLGYRFSSFYVDLAYVNKQRETTYHAFTPLIENGSTLQGSPSASIKDNNNQVVLSFGYKF
ncbi:MAG: outer membrane protein transport protein [Bacteroides sp.]|nr:outer membrane protein transport protein [Bacteroides sp.]MCM1389544.1 outer membrane protein transport protein [Bacteroides sp.]